MGLIIHKIIIQFMAIIPFFVNIRFLIIMSNKSSLIFYSYEKTMFLLYVLRIIVPFPSVAVDFFNQINMLYGTITEYCTTESCPVMSAGPKYVICNLLFNA